MAFISKGNTMKNTMPCVLIGALITAMLSGCSSPYALEDVRSSSSNEEPTYSNSIGDSYSRTKLYDSIDALASDSAAIIVGTIRQSSIVQDIPHVTMDFTIHDVLVLDVIRGSIQAGDSIIVRQMGSVNWNSEIGTILDEGETVLLFLERSGLDGELASHFYVTGATAGIYRLDPMDAVQMTDMTPGQLSKTDLHFIRMDADSGDLIPGNLTLASLRHELS